MVALFLAVPLKTVGDSTSSAIVLGAYFTKYYQGREGFYPPCQRPQSVSEIPSVKPFPAKPKPSRKTRGELLGDNRALLADATEALKSKGSRAGLSLRSRSPIRRMKKSRRPTSAGVRASKDSLLHARMASAASVNAMRALRAAESAKASAEAALGVTGRFGDYTNVYSTKRRMHGQEMRSTGRYDDSKDSIGGASSCGRRRKRKQRRGAFADTFVHSEQDGGDKLTIKLSQSSVDV